MTKFTLLLVFATMAVFVQGFPYRENDVASLAAQKKWDELSRLLHERVQARFGLNPVNEDLFHGKDFDVKNLQPVGGGHVYGESDFQFHSNSNVNGHNDEHSGGHKVINKDGLITEYDYTPQN